MPAYARVLRPCLAVAHRTPTTKAIMNRALNRLELLERLPAGLAVAHAAARRRAEQIFELRVHRAAVRAAEAVSLQLDELERLRRSRRRRRETGRAQLLASLGRDLVRRPRVVEDDLHLRLAAERAHLLGHRFAHPIEPRTAA